LFNVKALDQLLLVLKNSVYDIPIIPLRGMSNPYERKGILCTLIKAIIDLWLYCNRKFNVSHELFDSVLQ